MVYNLQKVQMLLLLHLKLKLIVLILYFYKLSLFFVIVDDVNDVKIKVKEYIINKTKENIKEQTIDIEDDDVLESLDFFGIKA